VQDTKQMTARPITGIRKRSSKRFRVLVVEDNDDLAAMLGVLLKVDGHEAVVVHDGARAMEVACAFQPRVILCDLGLPGAMNGHDVARACRKHPELRDVVLVALTGYVGAEAEQCSLDAGFDMHVTKPIGLRGLRHLLDEEVELVRTGT